MADFEVFDEVDLGEAVWRTRPGDTIFLRKGQYGRVVLKAGNLVFPRDSEASIATVAGVRGSCNLICPQWRPENIRSVFIYRKRLPFNLRINPDQEYFHPSGVAVRLVGHHPESAALTTEGAVPMEEQLPKAVVDVEVLSMAEVDFQLLQKDPSSLTPEELVKLVGEERNLERLLFGDPVGLRIGEIEYLAVWAVNQFLRRYSIIAELGPAKGFSIAEFRDGVTVRYKRPGPGEWIVRNFGYIKNFSTVPFEPAQGERLLRECLDAPDYSVSEYIEFALEHLNYSMATVGMAQLLEAKGMVDNWWGVLENSGLTAEQQRHIAEIIICRNVILHQHECAVKENAKGYDGARKRFGIEPLSEYRIYATKRPWYWYREGVVPFLRMGSVETESLAAQPSTGGPAAQGE